MALSLNNLANLYFKQDRYDDAERLYLEALKYIRQKLGDNNVQCAYNLQNLGTLYRKLRRYKEAESNLVKALVMRQNLLGEKHPWVALSYFYLGVLYHEQGEHQKAKSLYNTALQIINTSNESNFHTQMILSQLNKIPNHITTLPLEDFGL